MQGKSGESEYAGDRRRRAENNFARLGNRGHDRQTGGKTGDAKARAEDAAAGGIRWGIGHGLSPRLV
jgi:hypothetical protein